MKSALSDFVHYLVAVSIFDHKYLYRYVQESAFFDTGQLFENSVMDMYFFYIRFYLGIFPFTSEASLFTYSFCIFDYFDPVY